MNRNKEDNRFKLAIIHSVLAQLYRPALERQWGIIKDLILRNSQLLKKADPNNMRAYHLSFAYNGKFYSIDPMEAPPVRNRVDPSLEEEVQAYQRTDAEIFFEKAKVEGYLANVMSLSRAPGDYLALLPQALHSIVHATITTSDWSTSLSQEKIDAFLLKHKALYDLMRIRLAVNLII